MNNNSNEEFKDEALIKGDLEELDPHMKITYEIFIKYLGEEIIRKVFSKNILWKDEGLEEFGKSIYKLFSSTINKGNEINNIINLIMKMVYTFLCEKHPQVCIRSIEIFEILLTEIKNSKTNLNYDFTITDRILIKIKEKLGDVNAKLRGRAVDLYSFMLKQESCDYNNLLSELVEDELKQIDSRKVIRSSKMILGKLSIFNNVFEDFNNALKDKRTEMNTFPFNLSSTYVIEKINHSKSEVRKLDSEIILKMYKIFGFKKLEPHLKKVDERELEKLEELIPEVKDIIQFLKMNPKGSENSIIAREKSPKERPKGRSTSKDKKGNSSSKQVNAKNSNKVYRLLKKC